MRIERQAERQGYFPLIGLGAIVLSFMGLSLAITAIGTARTTYADTARYTAKVAADERPVPAHLLRRW